MNSANLLAVCFLSLSLYASESRAGKFEDNKQAVFTACQKKWTNNATGAKAKPKETEVLCKCVTDSLFKSPNKKHVESWSNEELRDYVNVASGENGENFDVKTPRGKLIMGFTMAYMQALDSIKTCPEAIAFEKDLAEQKKKNGGK